MGEDYSLPGTPSTKIQDHASRSSPEVKLPTGAGAPGCGVVVFPLAGRCGKAPIPCHAAGANLWVGEAGVRAAGPRRVGRALILRVTASGPELNVGNHRGA